MLFPEIRVLDEAKAIVEYVASDEAMDADQEVIVSSGWRFNKFMKNSPFLDSHNYTSIKSALGMVLDFQVVDRRLIETAQWAVDVPENFLAQFGFRMTKAGYLKAVSVGFDIVRMVTPVSAGWGKAVKELGYGAFTNLKKIYLEQEQTELSACVLGVNPNAVARAYKACVLSDGDIDRLSTELGDRLSEISQVTKGVHDDSAGVPGAADESRDQARAEFLRVFEITIKGL